ncbi:MAG: SDR family oxidoreductase [Flavisolibacter sp.]|jgi:short-subunit dehydrogenase|nr:SDR family oxidoreductase [Flavisolibacter sp.]
MTYALVTGASKGIGKAIALELAGRKKNLLLVARNEAQLQELCAEVKQKSGVTADFLAIDLSEKNAPQLVLDWCTQKGYTVDVLINNAGYGLSGPFDKHPLQDHLNMMQLNMNALVEMTFHFLPHLKKQTKAYIMNIASSSAYQALPFMSLYAASKTFVLQFSRGLSYELSKTSVSLTVVSPGATDTAFVDRAQIGQKGLDLAKKFNMTPEAVAKIAVDGMYQEKTEVITGIMNKLGAALAWLLPKKIIEKTSAKIYQ